MFQFKYDKDKLNVVFLTFLYFLQSVPLGLIGSLPYILRYKELYFIFKIANLVICKGDKKLQDKQIYHLL